MIDQRTVEILTQVVYKEHCQHLTTLPTDVDGRAQFFDRVNMDTLELARVIWKVVTTIKKSKT